MNIKKFIFCLWILLSTLIIGCSRNVLFDEQNNQPLNYNFKIFDLKNIDETLTHQKYSYSTTMDKKYIGIISYQSENASMNQYLVNNYDSVDLTISKDSNFIISLHANGIIAYTWNIKNSFDNNILLFDHRSCIQIPLPSSRKDMVGENYDRQNFYFTPLKIGNEKLVLRYEHQTEERNDYFEFTLNIKIIEDKK